MTPIYLVVKCMDTRCKLQRIIGFSNSLLVAEKIRAEAATDGGTYEIYKSIHS